MANAFQAECLATAGLARLPIKDAEIYFLSSFIEAGEAKSLYETLYKEIAWQESEITLFGKRHKVPRLSALYGEPGLKYTYSGYTDEAKRWTPTLSKLNKRITAQIKFNFNSVLANLYRNGEDANGWHADNEPELGEAPVIASLSFGASRDFQLKHRVTKERYDIALNSGSILLMAGQTQQHWLHCVPRRKRCQEARINLTYRKIVSTV